MNKQMLLWFGENKSKHALKLDNKTTQIAPIKRSSVNDKNVFYLLNSSFNISTTINYNYVISAIARPSTQKEYLATTTFFEINRKVFIESYR